MNDRNNENSQVLPWTGERYLPEVGGDIELEHLHRYVFAKQFSLGKRVLDIASGEGYGSSLLAKSAANVVGVDISPEAVAHAKTKYKADNLEFRLGSCAAIPLADRSVDIVVSFETIEHHVEHDAMMHEIKRVLVPGGLLIISCPDKLEYSDKPGYDNPYHVKELYREEFTSLLGAHFKNHRIAGQRVVYGSAIFEENSSGRIKNYDRDDKSLTATPGIRHAVYLLAVASDAALPLTENSVFEASTTALHEQLVSLGREHEKVVAWAKDLDMAVIDRNKQISTLELSRTDVQQQLISLGQEYEKIATWARALNQAVIDRDGQIVTLNSKVDLIVLEKDAEIHYLRRRLNKTLRARFKRAAVPLRKAFAAIIGRRVLDLTPARPDSLLPSPEEAVSSVDTKAEAIDAEVETIKQSGLFDEAFYRSTYPDMNTPSFDVIRHYCEHGWREGRNPSANFDTRHYLATYSDILNADLNPFWHYVVAGASEQRQATRNPSLPPVQDMASGIDAEVEAIEKSGLFDEAYYRVMHPDLPPPPDDAIRHYCEHGWREGRNPSDDFDTRSYLAAYQDIRDADINPFWHYVFAGATEGRQGRPDTATCCEDDVRFGFVETDIKLIAFYASPDWAELRSGRPVSKGQSQPPLPHDELGFYDPSDWRSLKRQAEMAKRHGLHGFCFLLGSGLDDAAPPRPIDLFLAHNDIDFRFCVQIEPRSGAIPDALVASIVRAVSDDRIIRIHGRPVILVSVPSETQGAAFALRQLKERLGDRGGVSPFLIGRFGSREDTSGETLADLCDAAIDQPFAPVPGETGGFIPLDKNGVDVVPYSVIASQGVARARLAHGAVQPVFDCVTLGRDNTARKPARPLVYTRFHIKEYRRWIDAAIAGSRISHPVDRRLVFVNAWSDWNEGLFLEPDRQGGFCRLNETTRALIGIETGATMPRVSIVVPNFNHAPFLRRRLASIYAQTYQNIEVILMDDCSSDRSRSLLDEYAESYPDITRKLYNDKNSGGPFRQWAKGIKAATGDLVWIAESDDYCDERFLEVLIRCFEDEAILLAYSNCCFVDKNENPLPGVFEHYLSDLECADKWNNSYVETAHNEVKTGLGIKNTIPNASGVLFRRPIAMPLLDDESWLSMAVAGDWVFYLHIIRGGKIAYSTETTNFFRRYDGSAAEATYRKEVFYREVGMASRTVASLYNVPLAVLVRSRQNYREFYEKVVGGSSEKFELWFDYQSILNARENRLPNVMVSTMGFYPGGAEILPIRLANEFKRQGLSVLLLSAGLYPHEDGVRRMLRNDVPVVETADVEDVKTIIRDFGLEALNTHQWHIQKYPLQAPDVFRELRAHVASLHGMIEHGEAFAVSEEQLHSADRNVTTWVYTAEKNLVPFIDHGLFEKSSPRFVKLPNGMKPPTIVPVMRADIGIPEDAFALCCVSRAIPDKGWAETILVVERARALSGRDIRLILVGNGPVYDEFCSTGVPDFVYLAGFSENSVGHYASADMGIMLTRFKSESFPLTIVDCLFAGRPYIASDVGDIRNMLTTEDGIAGEVIELDNWEIQIEKSAQVVAAFATDGRKYAHALSLVQDLVNRYKIDSVASQYVRLFEADIRAFSSKVDAGSY